MIRYSKLQGLPLKATDGEIGHIASALFDEENWKVRYLVVETGSWLSKRKVLIAPEYIVEKNEDAGNVAVSLDKERIKNAPELDPQVPMERNSEEVLREYYGLPMYWSQHGDAIQLQHTPDPLRQRIEDRDVVSRKGSTLVGSENESDLSDLNTLIEFSVQSSDTDVGRLDDIIIDESNWRIDRFVVNLSNYMPSKLVLVNRGWLEDVRWAEEVVQLEATTSAVKGSPYYRPFDSLFVRDDELSEIVPRED